MTPIVGRFAADLFLRRFRAVLDLELRLLEETGEVLFGPFTLFSARTFPRELSRENFSARTGALFRGKACTELRSERLEAEERLVEVLGAALSELASG